MQYKKYQTSKHGWHRESEYPSHQNRSDRISLESTFSMFMCHGSSNTWGENMRGGYREPEVRCRANSDGGHQRGNCSLRIGEFIFANFFTDRDDDALPSYHRTKSEWYRYHRNDPPRGIIRDGCYGLYIGSKVSQVFYLWSGIRLWKKGKFFCREIFIVFLNF